jgi:hypothetical protein
MLTNLIVMLTASSFAEMSSRKLASRRAAAGS